MRRLSETKPELRPPPLPRNAGDEPATGWNGGGEVSGVCAEEGSVNAAKNSNVAWALAFVSGLASMVQGLEAVVPVLFACTALICGAVERSKS